MRTSRARRRLTEFGKNINDARHHYVIADLDFGTARLLAPPSSYRFAVELGVLKQ